MKHNLIIQLLMFVFLTRNVSMYKAFSTPLDDSPLLPLLLQSLSTQKHSPITASSIRDEYDYIVVGGGASGSIIASRLSEEPCVTVLLLEAGPEPPLLTEVPALCSYFWGSDFDWKFKTVPQKYAAKGIKNRQMSLIAGKMLGGSGSLNSMLYVRGNKNNYDYWAELGARGWSYKEIFRYFLKLEDNRSPAFLANGYHAAGGPITVEQPRSQSELNQGASAAAVSMGYQFVDSNGPRQTGIYDLQTNVRNNQRCSPVKGYLVPVDKRKNLDISVNTFVTRVIFKNDKATGVEFFKGKYQQVKARREVIMTAGTLNTAKILMLSGVGPKAVLNKFHIPIVADLPVGKNFHDHSGTNYFFTLNPNARGFREEVSDPANIIRYITNRSGPLAGGRFMAFLRGLNISTPFDFPNYGISVVGIDQTFLKNLGLTEKFYKNLLEPYEGRVIFQCLPQSLNVRSRGTVTLNSSNPFDPLLFDPNYLEDPRDLEDVVDGLKFCRKLLETEPMLRLGAKAFQTVMPGCEKYYFDNEDEYFRCYARSYTISYLHFVGTTKMGDPFDLTTVVDPELRVKGVKGLRVADASVMPQVPSGNTHIPVLMVAEKASDMIKGSIDCSKPKQTGVTFPDFGLKTFFLR